MNDESDLIVDWLRSVSHWGNPKEGKTPGKNSIWWGENVTKKGDKLRLYFGGDTVSEFSLRPSELTKNKESILDILKSIRSLDPIVIPIIKKKTPPVIQNSQFIITSDSEDSDDSSEEEPEEQEDITYEDRADSDIEDLDIEDLDIEDTEEIDNIEETDEVEDFGDDDSFDYNDD